MTQVLAKKPLSLSIPLDINSPQENVKSTVLSTPNPLKKSPQYQYNDNQPRKLYTPNAISVLSCIELLNQLLPSFFKLQKSISGLEKLTTQIGEVKSTLELRKMELDLYMNAELPSSLAPPKTPAFDNIQDITSPTNQHPYKKPESDVITIAHWVYDLQKNIWILTDKAIQYENTNTNIINQGSRRRKILDMGINLHNSWVHLMLHLGLLMSKQTVNNQDETNNNLRKLAFATGITDWMGK
jgi:hypothetical protein